MSEHQLGGFKVGDMVITPLGLKAVVEGIAQDRLDLRYEPVGTVSLKPGLVKHAPRRERD